MIILHLIVYPTVALAVLYPFLIQYKQPGFEWLEVPATALLILDAVLNYTTLALFTLDFPRPGEYTFSKRLSRLYHDDGWRGKVCRPICLYLDNFDPSGEHVKK